MSCQATIFGLLTLAIALSPSSLKAKVREITLKDLVDGSDLIVLAAVTKVEDGPTNLKIGEGALPPIKIATARVLEAWKGYPGHEVRYLGSSTWVCDISDAKVGERVVLFLTRPEDWPKVFAGSERSRMCGERAYA